MSNTDLRHSWTFDLAGLGLSAGALVHIAAWFGGPGWMASLGAPPSIVRSAADGAWSAFLATFAIAGLLVGLALCCFQAARQFRGVGIIRYVLALFAAVFIARGLLLVPFMLSGQRAWRTPVGPVVVTGDWFVAGSAVVLAIGILIAVGLYQRRVSHVRIAGDRSAS